MANYREASSSNQTRYISLFFQVFGLQYFSTKPKTNKNDHKFSWKYFMYFLLLLVILLFSCYGRLYMQPKIDTQEDDKKVVVQKFIEAASFVLVFITAGASMVQSYLTTQSNKEMFENFDKIAFLCWNRTFLKVQYKGFAKIFTVKMVLILIMLLVPYVLSAISDYHYQHGEERITRTEFTVLPFLLLKFTIIKFLFYADLLNFHLELIIQILQRPLADLINVVNIVDKLSLNMNIKPIRNVRDKLVERLAVTKQMYGLLWDNTGLFNKCTIFLLLSHLSVSLTIQSNFRYGLDNPTLYSSSIYWIDDCRILVIYALSEQSSFSVSYRQIH